MIGIGITSVLVTVCASALLFFGARILKMLQFRDLVLLTATVAVVYALFVRWEPRWWLASDVVVLMAALTFGATIGFTLRSRQAVIAFCAAAAIVDTISYSGGLTRTIVESYRAGESSILMYLSIAFPVGGTVRAIVGIGDLVILAAIFTGLDRLGHTGWWPFTVPVIGLLLALGTGLMIGGSPALPFVGGVTLFYLLFRSRPSAAPDQL